MKRKPAFIGFIGEMSVVDLLKYKGLAEEEHQADPNPLTAATIARLQQELDNRAKETRH